MVTKESIADARNALTAKLSAGSALPLSTVLETFDAIVACTDPEGKDPAPYKLQVRFHKDDWAGEKFTAVFYDRERPGHKLKNLRGVPAQLYTYLTQAGFKSTVEPWADYFYLIWDRNAPGPELIDRRTR